MLEFWLVSIIPKAVGINAVLQQSSFFLAEALTILLWSSASDRVGRKPVILLGLFGLSLSMYRFGLSTTFRGLVFRYELTTKFCSETLTKLFLLAEF